MSKSKKSRKARKKAAKAPDRAKDQAKAPKPASEGAEPEASEPADSPAAAREPTSKPSSPQPAKVNSDAPDLEPLQLDEAERKRLGWIYSLLGATTLLWFAAFHPLDFGALAWVAFIPLLVATAGARSLRRVFFYGAATGFLVHLVGISWLSLCDPAAWLGTVTAEAVYSGLSLLLTVWIQRRTGLPFYLVLPVVWTAFDFERGRYKFFAFPWLLVGQSQHAFEPLIQLSDLTGFYGPGFLVMMANGLGMDWLLTRPRVRTMLLAPGEAPVYAEGPPPRRVTIGAGLLIGLLALGCIYGLMRRAAVKAAREAGPTLLLIQSDVPSRNDRPFPDRLDTTRAILTLTDKAAAAHQVDGEPAFDAVVWPETMWHISFDEPYLGWLRRGQFAPESQLRVNRMLQRHARLMRLPNELDRPMLIGAIHDVHDIDGHRITDRRALHNSAFLLEPKEGLTARFDKVNLAPVSEYIPGKDSLVFGWFFHLMRSFVPDGFTVFEQGAGPVMFEVAGHKLAPNICFDVSFSHFMREATAAGAELHVNMSNYSWFRSSAALELSLVQGKLRAIETRRGVVKAVNSGPSVSFGPLGEITDGGDDLLPHRSRSVENEDDPINEGYLLCQTATTKLTSPYLIIGDTFAWLCILGALALAALAWQGRRFGAGPAEKSDAVADREAQL